MTDLNEGALAIWDPGGRPPGKMPFQSKRPVGANKNDAAGIDARSRTKHTVTPGRSATSEPIRRQHRHYEKSPRTFPHTPSSRPTVKDSSYFRFEAHTEGVASSYEMSRQSATRHCDAAVRWPLHPHHMTHMVITCILHIAR